MSPYLAIVSHGKSRTGTLARRAPIDGQEYPVYRFGSRRRSAFRWLVVGISVLLSNSLASYPLFAQAGLRESLERLDKNQDGQIEPDEITPMARPFLERISRARRNISLDRSNRIDELQEAARAYYAATNGVSGRDIRPRGEGTVMPFGPDPDQPLVPEFGLAEVRFPYLQADLDEADRSLRRSDRNGDGYIDRAEAASSQWTHRDAFDTDFDKDDRLSRLELAQRYARRRLLDNTSDELRRKVERTGSGVRPSTREDTKRRDDSRWWRRGGSGNWLTASILGRFDTNKNGRLDMQESRNLGIPPGEIDIDRDGELSRDELQAYLTQLQQQAGDPSQGLPGWFYERDADRDGQVAMAEFATEWTRENLEGFASLDRNGDGLLTAFEVAGSKAMVGGSYFNQNAEVLPPRKTVISEIEINEDFLIADLNVQLSITHTNTSFLDAFLTGPDGQRVELFTEVGGRGDNFDQTVFDDQSESRITKAKPPFEGSFMPEAMEKKETSLSYFNGKSAKGVWQLVIRGTRSDRFGMLHTWGLIVRPQEDMPSTSKPQSTGTGLSGPAAHDAQ